MISNTTYTNRGYTHQGYLTEDHNYFIFGDEFDEQRVNTKTRSIVMEVKNLVRPKIAGFYYSPVTATDHNQYVKGKYVYQANYRAGLRILEINDMASAKLTEVAYLDIFPSDNTNGFNGAWSVYPFFRSGSILISGIEQGLYIVKKEFL
jgi:choice-of-anchor B domain-containing protein